MVGHRELADVVERRRLRKYLHDLVLEPQRLGEELHVVPDADHAVGEASFAVLHGARQPPDQLQAGLVQFLGARQYLVFERPALVRQRELRAHAQHGDRRADRLDDVIDRPGAQALGLVARVGARGDEDDRNVGECRIALHRAQTRSR